MWTLPTLGGSVYALSFSPVATGLLALGGADQMIRSWDTLSLQNPYLTKTFWQGIRSKITAVRLALDIGDLGLGLVASLGGNISLMLGTVVLSTRWRFGSIQWSKQTESVVH